MPTVNELSQLIDKVIVKRGELVLDVIKRLENVTQIESAIIELKEALSALLEHPQVTEQLKSRLLEFEILFTSFEQAIANTTNQLESAKIRFERQAVTIGCSGQARVGKSTLLQTIGNLPNEAIPTGKGIPVTAVRSRLLHSSQERKATISLRDKRTFLNELIKPFHRELNLPIVNSFEEFRNFDYEQPGIAQDSNVELLVRLKQMQSAIPSYEQYLTGKNKIIEDLTNLRPWVAYPPQTEELKANCSRLYLAVKNVEIQCSFLLDVEKLILVDLPGLGEVNVDAEEHHLQGIKNEVDLVLLILRPTAQTSFWSDKDRKALNLISRAVEGINRLGDFVIIVVNYGQDDDEELYKILIKDIHKQLNENNPNSRYQVLTGDAINPESVREQILLPVLIHLVNRLPVMDQEILDLIITQWQPTLEKIQIAIDELATSLQSLPGQAATWSGNVYPKAKALREELAVQLGDFIRKLRQEMQGEKEEGAIKDENFIKAIEQKHQHIQTWIKNGLGKGEEEWLIQARGRFNVDKKVDAFAIEEINRARTYLTNTYSELDVYFNDKIAELWENIAIIISNCTGKLIEKNESGKQALEDFLIRLQKKGIGDPFPSLREATEYLLKCGTENAIFQSHLLPKLIEETQKLAPEKVKFENISYENEQADEFVLKIVSANIIQVSYAVQKTLKENPFVSSILYSAAVKFEDSLVRGTEADRQFFDFATLYKNEIWESEFKEIENNHAIVKRVGEAVNNLSTLINIAQSN